ncbi:MAG TPA: 3-keto-5-aminohexanoate cleavage protein [Solirubrobacter sp.]|nr:3-keto-5-aminohexanoate cleavage protein [Solirubrobacter sp.]
MVVQACLNGDRDAAVPLTPEQLGEDARACVAAGAVSLHAHPRDPDGLETFDAEHTAAALRAMRPSGAEISFSTGLWITGGDVDARLRAISAWTELPDVVSLNVFEEGFEDMAALLRRRGIGIEAGVWNTLGVEALAATGVKAHRILVEPHTETPAEAVQLAAEIDAALDDACITAPRLHHGTGPATWAVLDAAVPLGRDIRIGLEDVLTLPDGRRAPDNASLVVEAVLRYT